jgi:hypothetical protein
MPIINGRPAVKLEHGNELLRELDPEYSHERPGEVPGYTLDAVWDALAPFSAPRLSRPLVTNACDAFAGYLMLDAVIGNQDRHHMNWAVLGRRELARSYDHASCLGQF